MLCTSFQLLFMEILNAMIARNILVNTNVHLFLNVNETSRDIWKCIALVKINRWKVK